ncbi:MAG: hypothetical protein MH204_08740 [Fimbriimonadaceae bacterium]|nr:hypothetical protein [Fimbriimonadaceae bacterium]
MKDRLDKQTLIDLDVDDALPLEAKEVLEAELATDSEAAVDRASLKMVVQALRESEAPAYTSESIDRVKLAWEAEGIELETDRPAAPHWQYSLPIQD